MSIFDKRVNFKPFEYPETMDFVDKMNKTFWVHSEVEYTSDVQTSIPISQTSSAKW